MVHYLSIKFAALGQYCGLSRSARLACLVVGMMVASGGGSTLAAEPDTAIPAPRWTPLERMALARLEAAHADVASIQANRRELPPPPGWRDVRAIFHAHAEDSTHTGGTRPEMLADAQKAGVSVLCLTNHHRPPVDFITDSWRGVREGVLFIPGAEARGFLLYPTASVREQMDLPVPQLLDVVRRGGGLAFLSHIEERPGHSMEGLDGLEIYNRHADAKQDIAGLLAVLWRMTDPQSLRELEEGLRRFPDEMLASQNVYPREYLAKWDRETAHRRLTGVAANDCHHNQVILTKVVDENTVKIGTIVDPDDKYRPFSATVRPSLRQLTRGRQPGEIVGRLDFDPYFRSFRNAATHLWLPALTEEAVRDACRAGRAYVSHDWMCDATGFSWRLERAAGEGPHVIAWMGDELEMAADRQLVAEFPVACFFRVLRGGVEIARGRDRQAVVPVREPGVYRVEGWLTLDGEDRPWLYSNPIYIRPASAGPGSELP